MGSNLLLLVYVGAGNGAVDGQSDSIGHGGFWAIIERNKSLPENRGLAETHCESVSLAMHHLVFVINCMDAISFLWLIVCFPFEFFLSRYVKQLP
jgi:hypothetical protein